MSTTLEKPNTVEQTNNNDKTDAVNYSQKEEDVSVDEVSELSREWLEPPDGGWKAWLVVFGCFCSFLCS
ncbi:hypothetical protein BDA99DRAFT_158454 [Phascolomyces articulosus]|uniref:Uncharacterized protein n=1 Tax=Phascolomyces articulosus TaxID=60185 RepID=A0AAD5PAY9_9FUNG|nr:hypothetical protein BDA99DRAFT_158454 [Phascolomyces articulosus]